MKPPESSPDRRMPPSHSPRKAPPRTMVIAAAVAVAGLVAFAASLVQRTSTPSPQASAPTSSSAPAAGTIETIYFDAGSSAVPAQASDALVRIAEAARAGTAPLVVSALHGSAEGDRGVALASQRAQAVAHALEANGVARDRLVLSTPAPAPAGADEREARRVEVRIE